MWEVRHGWTRSPGSQSPFQCIPKVFDGVKVRALCGLVEFFHTKLIPLSHLHQTLQLAWRNQTGNILLVSTKTRLAHQTGKQRIGIRHRTGFYWVAVCFTPIHLTPGTLRVTWGFHASARPWKPIPWSYCCTVCVLILMSVEVWSSLGYEIKGALATQCTSALFDPLCDFTWSSTF